MNQDLTQGSLPLGRVEKSVIVGRDDIIRFSHSDPAILQSCNPAILANAVTDPQSILHPPTHPPSQHRHLLKDFLFLLKINDPSSLSFSLSLSLFSWRILSEMPGQFVPPTIQINHQHRHRHSQTKREREEQTDRRKH